MSWYRALPLFSWLACAAPDPPTDPSSAKPTEPTEPTEPTSSTSTTPELPTIPWLEDPGARLFGSDRPVEVDIELTEDAVQSLRDLPREWVAATVSIEGFPPEEGAVRLKGNGSFQPIDDKASFKIDLSRPEADNAIDGLDDLVLNNMVSDPSMLRESTAYEVYRAAGIPAPRSRHAVVRVNGNRKGLYLLLEDVDGRFLNRWYEDGDGPLYEMFDVELTQDGVANLDHDGGPDDRTLLYALADVLADPNATVSGAGSALLDLDAFLTYFATSGAIGQFDAYPYSFPGDDIYLYVDPTTERIQLLPHGADETFQDTDRPIDYVFGLLAVRCLEDPICEERFDAAVWDALDLMDAMDLPAMMAERSATIEDRLKEHHDPAEWLDGADARSALHAFITERRAQVDAMPGID